MYNLLIKVIVKVPSASLTNPFKFKFSCKNFCELVDDDYGFQHVLLKEPPLVWCTNDEV